MVKFIDAHRERWGGEPICRALQVAPSTYYAAVKRPLSARRQHDEQLKIEIGRVHRDNFGVYGMPWLGISFTVRLLRTARTCRRPLAPN